MYLRTHTGREINGPRGGIIATRSGATEAWFGSPADHCKVLTKWGVRHCDTEVKRPINYQGSGKIRTKRYGK